MNLDYFKNIENINLQSLPPIIRTEFEKHRYGFTIELDGTYYSHNVFNNLNADIFYVFNKDKLKQHIDFNKNLCLANDEYCTAFWDAYYDQNFLMGYPELENKIFQIFSGIHNKTNRIHKPDILRFKKNVSVYNSINFLQKHFQNYGNEVGCYIRDWTIILNNPNLFENIFNTHYLVKNDIQENQKQENFERRKTNNILPKTYEKEDIIKIIKPLSGYWKGSIILNENDFLRFTEYVFFIIENHCLPNEVLKFNKTGTTIQFIRKTIHSVYSEIGKKDKEEFISLVHLFKQLENTELRTTTSKFSAYAADYKNDIKNMITYK